MKLYKYMSEQTFTDHVSSHLHGEVHLSCWKELNDPLEGYFSYFVDEPNVSKLFEKKEGYRVSCFSSKFDNILLWSYYANRHKGVCLEFEVDIDNLPSRCEIRKVNYSTTLPKYNPNLEDDKQVKDFLTTKLAPWDHEKEWRLLAYRHLNDNIQIGRLTGIIFGVNYKNITGEHIANRCQGCDQSSPTLFKAIFDERTCDGITRIFKEPL